LHRAPKAVSDLSVADEEAQMKRAGRVAGLVCAVALAGSADAPDGFRRMMDDAMARMHSAMHVAYTGDADRDFARMMIPHHQGAIDMALAELRYGKDERLRRLAQEIVVAQKQEIDVMRLVLGGGPLK
jgi:uncharacterized protein (DUF305 family)